jgi:hypothetical protein
MSTQINEESGVTGKGVTRRDFIKYNSLIAAGPLLYGCAPQTEINLSSQNNLLLSSNRMSGSLKEALGPDVIKGASWYTANSVGDGLEFNFPKGQLAKSHYLISDLLYDGKDLVVFLVTLQEGENGAAFTLRFGLIAQCSARMRIPLSLVDMNRWRINRQGAWLKPTCGGSRVDLKKVDRMTFKIYRKNEKPVRWCMTPIAAVKEKVATITEPILPKGKLLDELGQSTLHNWPGKSKSVQQVTERLQSQLTNAPLEKWPDNFSKWGGWKEKRFEANGFFQKHFDGDRWWLVDPDGYAFWSVGLNCVLVGTGAEVKGLENALTWKPETDGPYAEMYRINKDRFTINYLTGNLIRAFGKSWRKKWEDITMAQLQQLGFNTVANWSDWEMARKAKFPYVRPMRFRPRKTKLVYRDFPDVFDPGFKADAMAYAQTLKSTADDPALIGYFMMNEPTWGFSEEIPAVGMLLNSFESATRDELGRFIFKRYRNDKEFAEAWQVNAAIKDVATGKWEHDLNAKAMEDLEAFTEIMVDKFFTTLGDACKQVDKDHMNLGVRYYTVPPKWAVKGMRSFDVFSINCYNNKIPSKELKTIHEKLNMPTMIGEFHFGALDVGLPASGIGHVRTQADRGKAYRIYVEDAAANPYCVGTHWFTLYDQSALGRFDGENYNIGFYDVCNRQHKPLCDAARKSHWGLYKIASNRLRPYRDEPEYLKKLFL